MFTQASFSVKVTKFLSSQACTREEHVVSETNSRQYHYEPLINPNPMYLQALLRTSVQVIFEDGTKISVPFVQPGPTDMTNREL